MFLMHMSVAAAATSEVAACDVPVVDVGASAESSLDNLTRLSYFDQC